jgi:hypothetical protein
MDDELKRLAYSKQARIRAVMQQWRDHLAAQGRRYGKIDVSIYAAWGGECLLREIASGPHADKTVLKGGTLFRVWDGLSARPTMDLDLQAIDQDTPGTDLRDWLLDAICSPAFAESTGLVCRRDALKVSTIKDGVLPEAWRIEGDATLGPPIAKAVDVHLCVEATWGCPPRDAVARSKVAPLLSKEASYSLLTAKPEWMAAEKLHSLVHRGLGNTRLKDFHDLALRLLPGEGFDPALLRGCLSHVFEVEFKGEDAWPADADAAPALTSAFATPEASGLWIERRWPEYVGRPWDPLRDPTLGHVCESIAIRLERMGLLAPCAVSRHALAFEALGRQGSSFGALGALLSASALPGFPAARLRDRLAAEDWVSGAPRRDPAAVLAAVLDGAERTKGFAAVAAEARQAGAPIEELVGRLSAAMSGEPTAIPAEARVDRAAAAPEPVSDERLGTLAAKLASKNLNDWLTGVATLCQARAVGQDVSAWAAAEPPVDRAKAAKAWASVARRNGFEQDLDKVMDDFAAAPTARP